MSRLRKRFRTEEPQPNYENPPTRVEWNSMKSYGSFTIMDQEQQPHIFRTGDDIFVLPTLPEGKDSSDLETNELWIARIDAIRAQASHNAWMRVQWYYHPDELDSCVPTFQSQYCGKRERIFSTHFDLIPTISCNGKANMMLLDECDPDQEIPVDGFYYRLTFDIRRRKKHIRPTLVTPFPLSCFCRTPYGPELHTMRWCTRCRRWFHKHCLKNSEVNSNDHSCLDTPDTEADTEIGIGATKVMLSKKDIECIRFLAFCPIEKGQHHGEVGNFRYVSRARRWIRRSASENGDPMAPVDWMEQFGLTEKRTPSKTTWMICPSCGSLVWLVFKINLRQSVYYLPD